MGVGWGGGEVAIFGNIGHFAGIFGDTFKSFFFFFDLSKFLVFWGVL